MHICALYKVYNSKKDPVPCFTQLGLAKGVKAKQGRLLVEGYNQLLLAPTVGTYVLRRAGGVLYGRLCPGKDELGTLKASS